MSKLKRILIMAGGTGGHVFPGLAVARYMQSQGVEVHWLGTEKGLESKVVPEANIPLHRISISGIRGKGRLTLLKAPFKILQAVWQSRQLIQSIKPDMVIGMGGFASGPGGLASWLLGCPLVIHEQNAKAGYTNLLLSRVAKKVLAGFPDAFKANFKVEVVGNPVRADIESISPPKERKSLLAQPPHLLVLGGSLGAKALNEMVPKALAKIPASERPAVMHQAGEQHFLETKNLYESINIKADVKPFISDMASAYAWADIVICRAGALTIAELCAAGLGGLLIPYPFAVDDHQTANALFMVKNQAAYCIQQSELTESRITDIVKEFIRHPDLRLRMANKAYELRKTAVTEKIYQICKEICS